MKKADKDQGVSLIETMIAVVIALIAVFGLGGLVFQATAVNKNQGSETTRSVIYAQDKMEKLLSLGAFNPTGCPTPSGKTPPGPNFCDCNQPSSVQASTYPTCNTTNVNDTGWSNGLLAGGAITVPPATLVFDCSSIPASQQGYIDYLDNNGIQLPQAGTPPVPTPGACSTIEMPKVSYVRQWQITDVTMPGTGPAIKQITVAVYSLGAVAGQGGKPIVILTSYIENPN